MQIAAVFTFHVVYCISEDKSVATYIYQFPFHIVKLLYITDLLLFHKVRIIEQVNSLTTPFIMLIQLVIPTSQAGALSH